MAPLRRRDAGHHCDESLRRSRGGAPGGALTAADELTCLARLDEALDAAGAAQRAEPDDIAPLILRGAIYFDQARYTDALGELDEALRRAPETGPVYYDRGRVLERLGRYDEAVADYDAALRLVPGLPGASEQRATALTQARGEGQPD